MTNIKRGQYGQIHTASRTDQYEGDYPSAYGRGCHVFAQAQGREIEIWGRWCAVSIPAPKAYAHAQQILALAIKKGMLEPEYCDVDRKHRGSARNYDLYDFAPGVALVQQRDTTCTKYGNRPKKQYWLIRRNGAGKLTVESADHAKARIAKLAKSDLPFGGIIAAITGKKAVKIKTATSAGQTGYKVVALDSTGALVSVWDASPWPVGQWRVERATNNHQGGFYYYATVGEAVAAAQNNEVFGNTGKDANKTLVLVRVELKGRTFHIGQGKCCATYLRVIEIIRPLDLAVAA